MIYKNLALFDLMKSEIFSFYLFCNSFCWFYLSFSNGLNLYIHHWTKAYFNNWLTTDYPEKTANIWRRYHWFPCQMMSEKRAQKFDTDDVSLPRSGLWHVISMEFLHLFLRSHLAGKPVVASPNVGCFFRLTADLKYFHNCNDICCH